jgi:hypothetical protein
MFELNDFGIIEKKLNETYMIMWDHIVKIKVFYNCHEGFEG